MPAYRTSFPIVVLALLAYASLPGAAQDPDKPVPTESREAGEARAHDKPAPPAERKDGAGSQTANPATTAPATPQQSGKTRIEGERRPEPAAQPGTAEKPATVEKPGEASKQAETAEEVPAEPKAEAQAQSDATEDTSFVADLPAEAVTQHSVDLPGRALHFTATAGSIPLTGGDGRVEARMAYIAYTLNGPDAKSRPVAFAFNGGPGSSSAWLHLGTLGPWRLPFDGDGARPSAPGVTVPNSETWLDFADLVLIDPIGTGYSRFETATPRTKRKEGARGGGSERRGNLKKTYWSVSGDVDSLAHFISKWVTQNDRHRSPKLLVGESYGGFRVPKIAHELQTDYGVGVSLLVMVSPVLDYTFLRSKRHLPFKTISLLPSLAAASLERRNTVPTPALMREAETYARDQYLVDLLHGPRDAAAVGRIVKRVSALTGLPAETVRAYGGRLDSFGYRRETDQATGHIASAYDATISGLSPEPDAPNARFQDPFITALRAPLTGAMLALHADTLGWRPDARYFLINGDVAGNWQYGNSPLPPENITALKSALALDPTLRVLVAHGYTDLVTQYFASTLLLDQLPAYDDPRRVIQVTYPGGHMFYSRDGSRAAFREDVLIMLAASLNGEPRKR